MHTIFTLLTTFPRIDLPYHLDGWLGWICAAALIVWGLRRWGGSPARFSRTTYWQLLLAFAVVVPLTTLFIGVGFSEENALPMPGMPVEPATSAIMVLSAIPWVLAGGILGPLAATALAFFSGLLLALWSTHSLFTPLECAGLALIFSATVRQHYRTTFYAWMRHPLGAAATLALAFAPIYIFTAFLASNGTLAVRMDYALTQTWQTMIARGVALIFASCFAEMLYLVRTPLWGEQATLEPAPTETSMSARFFAGSGVLVGVLLLSLMISDWVVAGRVARSMIRSRLSSTAQVAAQSMPFFLETGQNLLASMADENLLQMEQGEVPQVLAGRLRSVPYFRQLFLLDGRGQPIGGYPQERFEQILPTQEERAGISLALKGVEFQTYIVPPLPNENSAQISFLAAIEDIYGKPVGVLLGRTDLSSNPFTQPAIQALEEVKDTGGEGIILGEDGQILYHTIPSLVMTSYVGKIPQESGFFDDTSTQGTRSLVYYQPVVGQPWSVILTVPAEMAQQLVLEIAVPLLVLLLILSLIIFLFLRWVLRDITVSLQTMAHEATLIASGRLDHSLPVKGVDEIGRLGRAFEQMRVSLKSRLEELNRLLLVNQGVAANLQIEDAVQPILQSALSEEASAARIVFGQDVMPEMHSTGLTAYGSGPSSGRYAYLDERIFELMRDQDLLAVPNIGRVRHLNLPAEKPQPQSLIALALRDETTYYGVLWISYDALHKFTEEEVRYLSTLAGQAGVAAKNSRLYATAEIGRQRLEAVLASTPEPVLVIDEQMRLFLFNPAALQVPGLLDSPETGCPIQEALGRTELLDLITHSTGERLVTQEIEIANGRIYSASVSPVLSEGRLVGKVCMLRDITQYKELDSLKSDFVATVSHDLRSPLTLMRGYATMLQMVGELNGQQKSYVRKIITGVEGMAHLVNNLLDLGRIEAGISLQVEQVQPLEVVERVISSLQPQATQKSIQLEYETVDFPTEGETVTVKADPALLEHALYNLVENAIKFTSVGGQVDVRLRAQPNSVVFEVKDTGIGIAPLDLPQMFEKFYRSGRQEAYQERGTGLGLAIVKSIAERHGGRVWVESRLGKGSTFSLEVPYEPPRSQIKF